MDSSILFASSLAQALAYGGWNLFKLYKKRKYRDEVFVIVSARHSGITTMVDNLRKENPEYNRALLVDEDDVISKQPEKVKQHLLNLRDTNADSYMVEIFPMIRNHMASLREIHRNRPIVLFTSLQKLPEFIGVKSKRTLIVYTSGDFHKSLVEGLPNNGHDEGVVKRMSDTRDMLLQAHGEKLKYNSFASLRRNMELLLFNRATTL